MAEQVEEAAPFGNVKLKVMAYTIPMTLVARCKVESWKSGVLGQHLKLLVMVGTTLSKKTSMYCEF